MPMLAPHAFAGVTADTPFVAAVAAPGAPSALDISNEPVHALWFLFRGEQLIVNGPEQAPTPLLVDDPALLGLQPLRRQYVGWWRTPQGRVDCWSGDVGREATLPAGLAGVELRPLFGVWDDYWIDMAGRAKQISHWDRDHQFCSRCGQPTATMPTERAKRCSACGLTSYPRLSPAIIIAVTRRTEAGEEILLARNHRFPQGFFSVIAGFVEPGETLEECAAREVREEVGLQIRNVRYFGSQPWPFPNSLMIGFTAEYGGGEIRLEESEIADARWFTPATLPNLPPPISIARRLIEDYLARQR